MEENELILGRISLNAYEIKDKKKCPCPVIELLDWDNASEGELVVLKVLRHKEE